MESAYQQEIPTIFSKIGPPGSRYTAAHQIDTPEPSETCCFLRARVSLRNTLRPLLSLRFPLEIYRPTIPETITGDAQACQVCSRDTEILQVTPLHDL